MDILKPPDQVALANLIFICKYFNHTLPKTYKIGSLLHTHNPRWS